MFEIHNTLDITDFKEQGVELAKAIENAVKDTQRVVIRELPNELLMTQAQFDDLQKVTGTFESYIPDYYMFKTKLNVMEVRVKDART